MKKDFQPEQKIGSEQKPIVLPSATDSAKPIVVCSQSQVHTIKNDFTDKDDFWIEYSKKRDASFKKNREVSSQVKNTDKFKVLLKDDS